MQTPIEIDGAYGRGKHAKDVHNEDLCQIIVLPETTTLTLGHHLTDQDLFCLSSIKPPWPVGTSASIPYMFEPVIDPHYHLLSFEAAWPSNTFVMLLTDLCLDALS